jgi:hypothetical protein
MLILTLLAAAAATPVPAPSPARLKASVGALVGFGTRHTLSTTTDPKRGIGAAPASRSSGSAGASPARARRTA